MTFAWKHKDLNFLLWFTIVHLQCCCKVAFFWSLQATKRLHGDPEKKIPYMSSIMWTKLYLCTMSSWVTISLTREVGSNGWETKKKNLTPKWLLMVYTWYWICSTHVHKETHTALNTLSISILIKQSKPNNYLKSI